MFCVDCDGDRSYPWCILCFQDLRSTVVTGITSLDVIYMIESPRGICDGCRPYIGGSDSTGKTVCQRCLTPVAHDAVCRG